MAAEQGICKIQSCRISLRLEEINEYLTKNMKRTELESLHFMDMHILRLSGTVVQVFGAYEVIIKKSMVRSVYDMLVSFVIDKVVYVQINSREINRGEIHVVKATNESCYHVHESEILYVEAQHNHVIWHSVYGDIVANDSLMHLEQVLSDNFVRIQRGYLVNKSYVKCIRRCEKELENGEILSIPCKKYMQIKEKLMQ